MKSRSRLAPLLIAIGFLGVADRAWCLDYQRKPTPFGYVTVDPLDEEAATDEGIAAAEAAKAVLSLKKIRFAIVEEGADGHRWGDIVDGTIIYTWKFRHGHSERLSRSSSYLLRHEIGHDLFARYVVPRTRVDQYGTDAPDWLDEMAAVAFEGSTQQRERRRQAYRALKADGLLPLSRLLTMDHPELARAGPEQPGQTFTVAPPSSSDTIPFYLTIRAFYDYLVVGTRDTAIVAELAAAFRRGDAMEPWLLHRLGRQDTIASVEAMDFDFRSWLPEDPRYAAR